MNEALQRELAALLRKLSDAATQGASWAGEQIPPLVEEVLLFARIEHALMLGLLVALAYVGSRLLRYCHARAWDLDRYGELIPASVIGVLALAGAVIGGAVNARALLMAWFAPRLYIIEWLRDRV